MAEKVFVRVDCYFQEQPRLLQLQSNVKFANMLKILKQPGELFYQGRKLQSHDTPQSVGLLPGLENAVGLTFLPPSDVRPSAFQVGPSSVPQKNELEPRQPPPLAVPLNASSTTSVTPISTSGDVDRRNQEISAVLGLMRSQRQGAELKKPLPMTNSPLQLHSEPAQAPMEPQRRNLNSPSISVLQHNTTSRPRSTDSNHDGSPPTPHNEPPSMNTFSQSIQPHNPVERSVLRVYQPNVNLLRTC